MYFLFEISSWEKIMVNPDTFLMKDDKLIKSSVNEQQEAIKNNEAPQNTNNVFVVNWC